MRLRNLKDKEELMNSCPYLILKPEEYKKNWQKLFKNSNPIHLEVGMGKGDFIYNMAKAFPDINFIGVEKYTGVIARAIKKYPEVLPNLYIINIDALELINIFSKEVDTIYLNFSDPWPKKRQVNRRLTSPKFLDIYADLFKERKRIIMKTDNIDLFSYSLVSLSENGYIFKEVSLDLHKTGIFNIETEYEKKFSSLGYKINYFIATKD